MLVLDATMHPRCAVAAQDAFTQPSGLKSISSLQDTLLVRFEIDSGYGLLQATTTSCVVLDTILLQRGIPDQPLFGDVVALDGRTFVRATWSDNVSFLPRKPGPVPVLFREIPSGAEVLWSEPPRPDSTLLAGVDNAVYLAGAGPGQVVVAWRFRDIVALIDTAGLEVWRMHLGSTPAALPWVKMEDGEAFYRNLSVRTQAMSITTRRERVYLLAFADSVGFMKWPAGWRRELVTLDVATGSILRRDTLPAEFSGIIALGVDGETLLAPKADLLAAFDTANHDRYADVTAPRLDSSGMVSTETLRGRLQLVNYFAEYCGPCHIEFPYLIELDTEFARRGLSIVALSIDADRDAGKKFLEAFTARTFPAGWVGPSGFPGRGIPMTLLISPTGGIIQRIYGFPDSAGFANLRHRVDSLLRH